MLDSLLSPLTYLLDPTQRVFWGYLLISLLIAMGLLLYRSSDRSVVLVLRKIFARRVWLNRSTYLDCGLLVFNAWLKVFVLVPLLLGTFTVAFHVVKILNSTLGIQTHQGFESGMLLSLVYTVVLILALDLSRYALHRLMHANSWLWRIHKIHHSATSMTPLTLYRVHPFEVVLQYLRDVIITGVVTGLFFYFYGPGLEVMTIAGINAARLIFNLLGANLRHSHIWLSFGPFENVLISPAQHQIHHSVAPQHRNKNFGSQFAIWDLIFGSLYRTKGQERLAFGVSERSVS